MILVYCLFQLQPAVDKVKQLIPFKKILSAIKIKIWVYF